MMEPSGAVTRRPTCADQRMRWQRRRRDRDCFADGGSCFRRSAATSEAEQTLHGTSSVDDGQARRSGGSARWISARWTGVPVALGFLLAAGRAASVGAASAGGSHSCVVLAGGSIKCWGENFWGQTGQGDAEVRGKSASTMGDNLPAVPLGRRFDAVFVDSGGEFNCALASTGVVKCWGRNEYGQLGLGDNTTRGGPDTSGDMGDNLPPVNVGTRLSVEQISVGGTHACVVVQGGRVKCWGKNDKGQLGLGDLLHRGDDPGEMGDNLDFVDLGTGVVVTSLALGELHSCAVIDDGDVKCWGNNDGGQLGYGDLTPRGTGVPPGAMGDLLPTVDLGPEQKAIAVAAGFFHTCALLFSGSVKCWGFGSSGQLGQGNDMSIGTAPNTMGKKLPPVDLGTGRTAVAVSLGATHSCAVLDNESLKCWGGNIVRPNLGGTLGLGDLVNRGALPGQMGDKLPSVPLRLQADRGRISNVFAGRYHTCASGTGGELACFGLNSGGQLGEGSAEESLGDEPGEVASITAINLGTGATAMTQPPPGIGVELVPTSPTPVPTSQPVQTTPGPITRAPIPTAKPSLGTLAPLSSNESDADRTRNERTAASDGGGGGGAGATAGIATAAVLIPIIALFALLCWWRRKKRQRSEMKMPATSAVGGRDGGIYGRDRREDSFTSSENNVEANGDGKEEVIAMKSLVKPHALQSTAPMTDAGSNRGGDLHPQSLVEKMEDSSEALPRPTAAATTTAETAAPVPSAAAGGALPVPVAAAPSVGMSSSDDDSSRDGPSDLENPGALRRTGSNSSISTLGSTSTASSTWPPNEGFVTPARTDIPRGRGGASGASGRGGSIGGLEVLAAGFSTPANRVATVPDTPSPRSVSSSVYGTPAPPEMRLAQFARTAGGNTSLYGLPEMEIGRSTSNVNESDQAWPVGSKGVAAVAAAPIAGAAAAAAGGGAGAENISDANPSLETAVSPKMETALTPTDATRHRGSPGANAASLPGRAGGGWANRESGSNRSGGVGGGMGPEAAAQAFTEEAELEALQIDKHDLKLVFGRPFARGKSSEVYQVTHAGKNRAAKIIDLFSLGVVGEEVTRLYASFAQELRAMKGIRHESVVAVYGAVATPSELTIVTDLVKRGPLRALLNDKVKRESLTPTIRHKIIKDVATGMAYLSEQGVQHRNLHSHNVLITKEWGAKVADYGLAGTREVMLGAHDRAKRRSRTTTATTLRARVGNLRWMPPELLQPPPADGADPFTEASDVYSVGVIAWEILCGGSRLPYDGLPDDKVASMIIEGSTLPVAMETPIVYNKLMLLCWRKNPASRPTFSHIATELLKGPAPIQRASPR